MLRLDGNSFRGKLPNLPPSIREVRLQRNEIRGSVPEGYGELPHLHTLKAESNKLSGSIPSGRCECLEGPAETVYCCTEVAVVFGKSDMVKKQRKQYPPLWCG